MKNKAIFYSLCIEDIQTVAREQLERDLTQEEIERVKEIVAERIGWYNAISDVIREEIK